MSTKPRVLSIVESYLGHRTYGDLMQKYFSQNSVCETVVCWYNSDRDWITRVINRLLSFRLPNRWIQSQNLDLHWFRVQIGYAYMSRRLAVRQLNFRKCQTHYAVLHFHTQILAFAALDLMKTLPTVVSLDMTAAQASRLKTIPALRWTYAPNQYLERQVYQTAAAIVAFSEAARRSVVDDYDIDPNKVKVIYPGVDLNTITPSNTPTHTADRLYQILFVGGDFERKGGFDLLAVFLESFAGQAELHLVTQAAIAGTHPNVHVYTHVRAYTPEWLALYHQADVFVMPTYAEPFGWVFIEAMAAGLPVVATQLNAIPEMVAHGETGFLVQPGDRSALTSYLQTLMANPDLGREMGRKGRQIAESKFDARQNFQALDAVFQSVAQSSIQGDLSDGLNSALKTYSTSPSL